MRFGVFSSLITGLLALGLVFNSGSSLAIPLATPDAVIVVPPAGVHPFGSKTAYIWGIPGAQAPSVSLFNPKKPGFLPGMLGKTVASNLPVTSASASQVGVSTGNYPLWQVDFSAFQTPGSYELRVLPAVRAKNNVFPVAIPKPIEISEFLYWDAMVTNLKGLYLTRSGSKVSMGEVDRPASHTNDAWLEDGDATRLKDVTGGWYNGGNDYRKITTTTAFALGCWLQTALQSPDAFLSMKLSYPIGEANVGDVPDALHELKWGLDWLLAMQGRDGRVFHVVVNADSLTEMPQSPSMVAYGFPAIRPDEDDSSRFITGQYRQDTAAAVAVWAMASRAFKKSDVAQSVRYMMGAQRGWAALQAMPASTGLSSETEYLVADDTPYRIWAAWSLYKATNEPRYKVAALQWLDEWSRREGSNGDLSIISWKNPLLLAWMDGLAAEKQAKATNNSSYSGTQALSQETWQRASANLRGITLSLGNKPLDIPSFPDSLQLSNAPTVATLQAIASVLSQAPVAQGGLLPKSTLVECSKAMDRILGYHRLRKSWLTGVGSQSAQQPGHAVSVTLRKPIQGLLVDGPNPANPSPRYDDAWDNPDNHSELWSNALAGWVLATLHTQWQGVMDTENIQRGPKEYLPTEADPKRWAPNPEPAAKGGA
ncbi:MAG: glycoside hydrolase family 9 protein [Vampirovibrionales bacterium]|nr:glycoside hydrolase family 9 protein [Vampirovibrionales bacterium]